MLDFLNTFFSFLLENDYICFAFCLFFAILGFLGGFYLATIKNKAKVLPDTSSTDHCDISGRYEFIEFTEGEPFFKPKITKCSCSFYKKGICAKTQQTCFLISQYSQDYFKKL